MRILFCCNIVELAVKKLQAFAKLAIYHHGEETSTGYIHTCLYSLIWALCIFWMLAARKFSWQAEEFTQKQIDNTVSKHLFLRFSVDNIYS